MMSLVLPTEHLDLAKRVALSRNATHRNASRADGVVSPNSLQSDIDGAYGEIAVALALELPWANALLPIERWLLSRDNLPDVGRFEVKSTRHRNGCLLLQKHSSPQFPYILVVLDELPKVKLVGWLYGHEVQQEKYWRTNVPKPCFMAPQRALRALDDLIVGKVA